MAWLALHKKRKKNGNTFYLWDFASWLEKYVKQQGLFSPLVKYAYADIWWNCEKSLSPFIISAWFPTSHLTNLLLFSKTGDDI